MALAAGCAWPWSSLRGDGGGPTDGGVPPADAGDAGCPSTASELVSMRSNWRFLDDGTDPGGGWPRPTFVDTAWRTGQAAFGYGEPTSEVNTEVGYGSNPNDRHITTYFRHAFEVADPSAYRGWVLRMQRDDGAVVYLNGTEVFRSNMPPGVIRHGTLAAAGVHGAQEDVVHEAAVPEALFVAGRNVLAVEVHQYSPDSADLFFDAALVACPAR